MADVYQSQGGDIGALLRQIQEEKSTDVLNAPPAAQPGSPVRDLAQGPILAPESPGSTRVSSIKPEGVTPTAPSAAQTVVAPQAYNPPAPVPSVAASAPIQNSSSPAPRPASPSVSAPVIGTKIAPAPVKQVMAAVTKTPSATLKPAAPAKTPSTSKIGTQVIAKNFVGTKPGQNIADKIIDTILKKAPGNVVQKLAPKLFA